MKYMYNYERKKRNIYIYMKGEALEKRGDILRRDHQFFKKGRVVG